MTSRKRGIGVFVILSLVILFGGILAIRERSADHKPLGESPSIRFESTAAPDDTTRLFLEGNFAIIKDVQALPASILKACTEIGGSRHVLANPGHRFEATDVIRDESLPRKRLIFAGVSGNRWFVHYEQGGRGHSFRLAFFQVTSPSTMKPLWLGFCGPAKDIADLRSQVRAGCSR